MSAFARAFAQYPKETELEVEVQISIVLCRFQNDSIGIAKICDRSEADMLRRVVHPDPVRDKLLVKSIEIVDLETDVSGADLACFVVNQRLASGRELDQFGRPEPRRRAAARPRGSQ
jgi:hypothetical protein